MWKWPRFAVRNQELSKLNISQGEHHDLSYGFDNALDLGWGTFGTEEAFWDSMVTCLDGATKTTLFHWTGTSADSFFTVELQWTQGWLQFQFGHTENFHGNQWDIIPEGNPLCSPGRKTPGGSHIHVTVNHRDITGALTPLNTRDIIFNNVFIPDPIPTPNPEIEQLRKDVDKIQSIMVEASNLYQNKSEIDKKLADLFATVKSK